MNDQDTRRLESFLRVQEFGRHHEVRFPANSYAAELFTHLTDIINALEGHAANQSSGLRAVQQSATSKASAREELLQALRAIARTARAMSVLNPGLEERFRVRHDAKDQDLLNIARSIMADAATFSTQFIKFGLPADFLTSLDDDIKSFELSLTRQIEGTETHVAASAAIEDQMEEGIKTMQQLNALMRNLFADDPGILAEWFSSSRVERAPRKAAKKTPPPK